MNVVILDTGCANLHSVKSAVARHGYDPVVSRDPDVVLRADKLFLPGVGTAQAAMDQLHERELIELIKACTQPVLGICLGMQLLGRRSEESNGVSLLGIIEQDVPKMTDFGLPLPWAGIASIRRREIVCSRALKMARISTLYTATLCR
jgi:glutamine amidotransferase